MTKQEIIAAFEQAEKDWGRYYFSLCSYFCCIQETRISTTQEYLQPLWEKYRTREGALHFNNQEERLEAIRKVLNDLKKQDESI